MVRLSTCIQTEEMSRYTETVFLSESPCCFSALSKLFCFQFFRRTPRFHLCSTLFLQPDRQLLTLGGTPWVLDPKPAMSALHSRAPDTYVWVCVCVCVCEPQLSALLKGKITAFKVSGVSTCSRPDPDLGVAPHASVIDVLLQQSSSCFSKSLFPF